jgi:hypothetical protein
MAAFHLHCGSFKTGSSSIQNSFWGQRDMLQQQGWLYPRAGLMLHKPEIGVRHARLAYAYKKRPEVWKRLVEDLLAEIEHSGCPNVVISSEAWSDPREVESLRQLLSVLRARGHGPVHGYVYLRNVAKYARSHFRFRTRLGKNRLPFVRYVNVKQRVFDLAEIASRLRSAFGREMTAISFESLGDVVKDFSRRLGVSLRADAEERANVGIGALDAEAQRQLTLAGAGRKRSDFPGAEVLLAEVGIVLENPQAWVEPIPQCLRSQVVGMQERMTAIGCLTAVEVAALTELPAEGEGSDVRLLSPLLAAQIEEWLAGGGGARKRGRSSPRRGHAGKAV